MAWLMVRASAQVAMVVLLARWLGAQVYGEFITALAIASFFTPLAGMGLQAVVLREGAANPDKLYVLLKRALRIWRLAWVGATLLAALVGWAFLPRPASTPLFILLCAGEIGAGSLVELLGRSQQARERPQRFGQLLAGLSLARLAALGALLALHELTLESWVLAYVSSSMAYAALVLRLAPCPAVDTTSLEHTDRQLVRLGLPFVSGAIAFRIQAEFNKPVLARLGYSLAGNFSVAQRAVDVANLPLMALQEALWPRVFASEDPRGRIFHSGSAIMALALLGGTLLAICAPLLPRLLGAGYAETASLLALLAWLPAVQVVRGLSNALLMAERRFDVLLRVYVFGTASAMLTNLVLILAYHLSGAVIAAYANEALVIGFQLLLARRPSRVNHS